MAGFGSEIAIAYLLLIMRKMQCLENRQNWLRRAIANLMVLGSIPPRYCLSQFCHPEVLREDLGSIYAIEL